MMNMLRVENHPELRKDPVSGVVFFVDEEANRKHEILKASSNKARSMQAEINDLKNDMNTIKSMLETLINK